MPPGCLQVCGCLQAPQLMVYAGPKAAWGALGVA